MTQSGQIGQKDTKNCRTPVLQSIVHYFTWCELKGTVGSGDVCLLSNKMEQLHGGGALARLHLGSIVSERRRTSGWLNCALILKLIVYTIHSEHDAAHTITRLRAGGPAHRHPQEAADFLCTRFISVHGN